MPAARGSKQIIRAIKEATFGTTPATPTMIELPVNSFNADKAVGVIQSGQIRSHPFIDRLIKGPETHDIEIATELQDDTHDLLLELLTGAAWATNATKVSDALVGATIERGTTDLSRFDQFTGAVVRRGEFNAVAGEDSIVTMNYGIMARGGTLDATTTLASTTTPAVAVDPFVFSEAAVTIGGVSRPVTALSWTLERQVDPLYVLGTAVPREYIPSTVTLNGRITVPWEDDVESGQLSNFTDVAIVAAVTKGAAHRTFTIPKAKLGRLGRRTGDRGVVLQEIDFQAFYDTTSQTVMTISRSA